MSGPAAAAVAELKRQSDAVLWVDLKQALRMARSARDRGRASGDALARALGEHALANSYLAAGRHRPAVALYERAAVAYDALGRKRERAAVDLTRILPLLLLARYAEAERAGRAARAAFRSLGDAAGAAKVLINLATLRQAQDRHLEAVEMLERARPVFVASGDRALIATIDLDRALSYSLLARFDLSASLFAAARGEFAALGREEAVARVDYNLAYDHFLQGRFHESRRLLRASREEFRRAGSSYGLAFAALDEAETDLALNLPRAAANAAAEAYASFLGQGSIVPAARAALAAAEAARRSGDERQAELELGRASAGFARTRHRSGLASVDLLRAGTPSLGLSERGRLAERAARAFRVLGLHAREAMALVVAANVFLEQGREARARTLLARARVGARRRSLHEVELRVEHVLARTEVARGRPGRALVHYRRSIGAYEKLRAGIRSDEDRLAFAADKTAVFEEALGAALDLGRTEVAFELLERARARALVDLLAADSRFIEAVLASGSVLSRRLARLRRDLARLEGRERSSERHSGGVSAELAAEMRRVLKARDVAIDRLAVASPEASYAVAGWPVAPIDAVRAVLGPDRVLVAYFVEGDRFGAAIVSDREVRFVRALSRRADVDRALSALQFGLVMPRIDPERTRAHAASCLEAATTPLAELRRLLLESIEPFLGGRALVVVPHAHLNLVPFHALMRRGSPLCAEREVTTAPSATVLVRAMARKPRTTSALVLSVADENAPAIAAEADAVARALGRVRRLDGDQATVAGLRRHAPAARVIHLATHGIFEPSEPLLSGLRLADGRMTLPEVSALGLDAQLVTLSACESAAGAQTGNEVLGLVRSFLQAGTRALVAALWPVSDSSTAILMESFYRRLARGETIARALGAAALELRAERPHPYHWAPFLVVGDWGSLYSRSNPRIPVRSCR